MTEIDGIKLEYTDDDKQSALNTLERIQHYVNHYQVLLRYTKHSVRRKKLQIELMWWEQELVKHNFTKLKELQEQYIQGINSNKSNVYSYLGALGVSPKHLKMYEESLNKLEEGTKMYEESLNKLEEGTMVKSEKI